MTTFTLDTSGFVRADDPLPMSRAYTWSDLSPFVQGYVEALLRELDAKRWAAYRASCAASPGRHLPVPLHPRFDWLSPEALALILKDCATVAHRIFAGTALSAEDGRRLWEHRAVGFPGPLATDLMLRDALPPLIPYLSDEGKVCLREAI